MIIENHIKANFSVCKVLVGHKYIYSFTYNHKVAAAGPDGPERLQYLWYGHLQKAFAYPWLSTVSYQCCVCGRSQWLMLVIPTLWEAKAGGSPEVRSSRPAWPTWWNPISKLNIQKLARHGGAHVWSQLFGRLRQENCLNLGSRGCSELRSRQCNPAWVTDETLPQKLKKINSIWILGDVF